MDKHSKSSHNQLLMINNFLLINRALSGETPLPVSNLSSLTRLKIEYFYCKSIFKPNRMLITFKNDGKQANTGFPTLRLLMYKIVN